MSYRKTAAQKYTALWRNTLLINCNWEQTAKELITAVHWWQIINKFPHMNRNARREAQCRQAVHKVNNFPSFQTSSAIRHADSLAKSVCTSQPAVHRSPWTCQQRKELPCTSPNQLVGLTRSTAHSAKDGKIYERDNTLRPEKTVQLTQRKDEHYVRAVLRVGIHNSSKCRRRKHWHVKAKRILSCYNPHHACARTEHLEVVKQTSDSCSSTSKRSDDLPCLTTSNKSPVTVPDHGKLFRRDTNNNLKSCIKL
jgi:hypothetical protein